MKAGKERVLAGNVQGCGCSKWQRLPHHSLGYSWSLHLHEPRHWDLSSKVQNAINVSRVFNQTQNLTTYIFKMIQWCFWYEDQKYVGEFQKYHLQNKLYKINENRDPKCPKIFSKVVQAIQIILFHFVFNFTILAYFIFLL